MFLPSKTQFPKLAFFLINKRSLIAVRLVTTPAEVELLINVCRNYLGLSIYDLTSPGASTKSSLNLSLPHSMQCSIWFGKFLNVHIGIDSSGGS